MVTDPDGWGVPAHHNLAEYYRELARWSGDEGETSESDGVLLFSSGTTFPILLNGVIPLEDDADPHDLLVLAEDWFATRGKGYTVCVRSSEDDLAQAAEDAGLVRIVDTPEMICAERPETRPLPEGAELRWVADIDSSSDATARLRNGSP
jgi:hypothetical protein